MIIRSLKNYSQEIFVKAVSELNYPNYSTFTDVDVAYEDFISRTMSVIDNLAPRKKGPYKGK